MWFFLEIKISGTLIGESILSGDRCPERGGKNGHGWVLLPLPKAREWQKMLRKVYCLDESYAQNFLKTQNEQIRKISTNARWKD